jgi:hypothetical protein
VSSSPCTISAGSCAPAQHRGTDQDHCLHGLRILQGYVGCDASPGGVADEDALLESKGVHQFQGKLCLLRRIIWVVAVPVMPEGALGQPGTRAVIGKDRPELCESGSDVVPREGAGPEPMQEQNEGVALPVDLVMKLYTRYGDEPAASVGEFVGRPALVQVHGDKQRHARSVSLCLLRHLRKEVGSRLDDQAPLLGGSDGGRVVADLCTI